MHLRVSNGMLCVACFMACECVASHSRCEVAKPRSHSPVQMCEVTLVAPSHHPAVHPVNRNRSRYQNPLSSAFPGRTREPEYARKTMGCGVGMRRRTLGKFFFAAALEVPTLAECGGVVPGVSARIRRTA